MNEKPYPFLLSRMEFRYEFTSISPEKEVQKIVLITQTNTPQVFNVALLDVLEDGNMSDISITNNRDLRTVLATVIKIIEEFLNAHPKCFVVFKGSDARRQNLYRTVISREIIAILHKFQVWGGTENDIERFNPEIQYEYYLIEKNEGK
jgi:hypothetical protein